MIHRAALTAGVFLALAVTFAFAISPDEELTHTKGVLHGCQLVKKGKLPRDRMEGVQWGLCMGIIQTLQATGNHLQSNMRHCAPLDAPTEQIVRVFLKYTEDHPERLNHGPEILAIEALKTAWPCPN